MIPEIRVPVVPPGELSVALHWLVQLVQAVRKTAVRVRETSSARREQAPGVSQMNSAMSQLDKVTCPQSADLRGAA